MAACNAKWGYGNPLREFAGRQHTRNTRAMPKTTVKVIRAESTPAAINPSIRKTEEKVVDNVPVAELSKPITAYCRCWRSQTFPLCDGSHVKHNKATGDNGRLKPGHGIYLFNFSLGKYAAVNQITTADGFRLGVQRINSRSNSGQKGPVFLNHGVLSGGDTWVLNPPDQSDKSSAFILADAGYDVWIGNARTTRYSYGHQNLTEEDAAYWDWSLDELAASDLPNMMHMVNSITNKKIYYIGFSQGSQAALAALSDGNLGDIVEKMALLAPVAYVSHAYTPIGVAAVNLHLDQVFEALGLHSFSTKTETGKHYVDLICKAANLGCYEDLASAFTGINCCINNSRIVFYDKYETQATSTKNLVHLAQLYRADKFQKYDYGLLENVKRYNFIKPPVYELSKVPTKNLLLAYGAMDALANILDVERLKLELNPGYQTLFKPLYAHLDFILAYNLKEQVYDHVLDFFQN